MDNTRFEDYAIGLIERDGLVFRSKCMIAHIAVSNGAERHLASLWPGRSLQYVRGLARIWANFDWQDVSPEVDVSLYKAAIDAAGNTDLSPAQWLRVAIEDGLSSGDLRKLADIARGRHAASYAFKGEVQVVAWDVETGTVTVEGLPISGPSPETAQVTVREVLQR